MIGKADDGVLGDFGTGACGGGNGDEGQGVGGQGVGGAGTFQMVHHGGGLGDQGGKRLAHIDDRTTTDGKNPIGAVGAGGG